MTETSLTAGHSSGNVRFLTAQKMIHRLLACDRIKTEEGKIRAHETCDKPEIKIGAFTKNELAKKLGISVRELEKLKYPDFYKSKARKISLPLSRLYCATKFADGEYKGE